MIARIKAFLTLGRADRARLLRALWLLPWTHVVLLLTGLKHSPSSARQTAVPEPIELPAAAKRCRWAVDAASAHGLVRGTCLSRSIALLELIRREGIPGTLRFGASWDGGRFDAHAWVEIGNVPLNESPDVAQRYPPFSERFSAK